MKKTTKEKAIRNDPHPDPSIFAVYMIQGEEPPALEPAALEYQALPARHSHCLFPDRTTFGRFAVPERMFLCCGGIRP